MKKILFFNRLLLITLLYSGDTYSAQANLISCEYVYGRESKTVWRGTYESLVDDRIIVRTFNSYCPQIIVI